MPKEKQIAQKVRSTSRNEVKTKLSKNQDQKIQIIVKKQQVQEKDSDQSSGLSQQKSKNSTNDKQNLKKSRKPLEKIENNFSEQSADESSQSSKDIKYPKGTYLAYVDPSLDDPTQFKICQLSEDIHDIENDEEQYQCSIFETVNQDLLEFNLAYKISFVFAFTIISPVKIEVLPKQNAEKIKISKKELKIIQILLPDILSKIYHESSDEEESEDENKSSLKKPVVKIKAKKKDDETEKSQISQQNIQKVIKKSRNLNKSTLIDEDSEDGNINKSSRKSKKDVSKKFKLNKWNPDIEIEEFEQQKMSRSDKISSDCCISCSNREVHRAVLIKDYKLLNKCIEARNIISSVNDVWGPDCKDTPFSIALIMGDHKALECILKPKSGQNGDMLNFLNDIYNNRVKQGGYLMSYVDSGKIEGNMAYGSHVRTVEMSRGNRQGNNAFLQHDYFEADPINSFMAYGDNQKIFSSRKLSPELLIIIQKLTANRYNNFTQQLSHKVNQLVLAGDYILMRHIIKDLWQQTNYGYNQLHYQVLCDLEPEGKLPEFKSVNCQKKCQSASGLTPFHLACINPNSEILKQILFMNGDFNMTDIQGRKPIHFASVCEKVDCLKVLMEKGANLLDVDMNKNTTLYFAVQANRPDNVTFILSQAPQILNLKNKMSKSPMQIACEEKYFDCIKILIQSGIKINTGLGRDRMPPLLYAAQNGDYEIAEWLLDNSAKVQSKDKFKRTALIMACRNGHIKLVSLLLQRGADWQQTDSSGNSPLHYAAAYGWPDLIKLLLKTGAKINIENSWRTTPINIAMLKNHEGCVKTFLEYPDVDVNCKDEKGRTLLSLSLININERTQAFVQYLLEKNADTNIADIDGKTPLHYLADINPKQVAQRSNHYNNSYGILEQKNRILEEIKKIKNYQLNLADLLVTNGASLKAVDNLKQTPFSICLEKDNVELLEKLLIGVTLDSDPSLLHCFTKRILDSRYQNILIKLLKNTQPSVETMNIIDDQGITPFLAYLNNFSDNFQELQSLLIQLCNFKAIQFKDNFQMYNLKNSDLFDKDLKEEIIEKTQNQNRQFGLYSQKYQIQTNLQVVQDFVPHEKILKFANQLISDLVTKPFIDILREIINEGANPFQQVQKLKKFRLQEIQNNQNQITQENQIQERIRKREEVLQERERKNKKARRNRDQTQQQELRPGEGTGNSEYHTLFGLRNAFHFVINQPQPLLINFLQELAVDPDVQDHRGITPFNAMMLKLTNDQSNLKDITIQKFISYGVRIDLPDFKGRTPFLNLYSLNNKQDIARSENLLQLGAKVNQIDASGLFALKYALIRRDREQIEKLIKTYNANVNQIDSTGRNLLHHAVNMSSATADATFEIEQQLIDFGIDINLQDNKQRTPLHYAFVKIQNWKDKSQIDPIETVSGLCATKGLKPDLPDKWLKTPLHYASSRGASICFIYLQKSGANIEAIDIYGNTPLGVALQAKHFNYCILMIQKQANINKLVYKETPELLAAKWKQENQDVEMEDQKAHRNLFDQQTKNVFYGSEQDSQDESSDDQFEQTMFNQQNAFRQKVFAKKAAFKTLAPPPIQEEEKPVEEEPMSMFRISIRNTQLGLAYLILDQEFSLMLAMQDALDEKKFQLVLTLLQKVQDDRILKQKNEKGQNLFHVLCQNAKHCAHDHMMRIYYKLKKRGLNCLELDHQNRSALHYAVNGGTFNLVEILLSEGLSARQQDKEGLTPLATYLRGDKCLTTKLYNSNTASFDPIFKKLVDAGSQIDQEYQEDFYKSEQQYKCTILINVVRNLANINDFQEFQEKVFPNVFGLLKAGAQLNIPDSNGRDCMIYAVIANNNYLVDLLLQNAQFRPSDLRRQDYLRKSVAHYIVQPMPLASYENIQLLDKIHQAGYDLNLKDNDGLTPLDYALKQSTGKMAKKLHSFLNTSKQKFPDKKFSGIPENEWTFPKIDYKKDSELLIKEAQLREDEEMKDSNKIKELVPVDSTGKFQKSYSVYVELGLKDPSTGEDLPPKPWDAYLTKVDLKNGLYGDYVFYKMQLLYDSVRDLYVVFTRWGRIGENGMNQRTPFPKLEDAKADFCLTFKAKTGNDFSVPEVGRNFQRMKKKYDLARITYSTVNHQDYMAPFDFDNCPKAKGIDSSILELIEEIANITMFQKAVRQLGLDTKAMPIANLSKETINQAIFILGQIKEVLEKDKEITEKGINADHDELQKVKDQISDLSSRYYELIPLAQFHNQIAPPLTQLNELKQHFETLQSLSNIEMASKILLGAIYRQKQINPIQYVYEVLNIKIDLLKNDSSEYEILIKYIKSTNEGSINFQTHKIKIFKIQRKGEAERINSTNLQNHKLLYHGSQLFNFIGILSDGLRIAPPEAPATGYMFGKGVYFADMLQKSYQYSQQRLGFFGGLGNHERAQDSTLLLMCEVALGNQKKVWRPTENGEPVKLENTKHSVHGVGKHGPDYSQSLFLKNGIEIPQGKIIEYKDYEPQTEQKQNATQNQFGFQVPGTGIFGNNQGFNQQQQLQVYLAHNEYIVYNSDQVRMRYLIQIVKKTKEEMNI